MLEENKDKSVKGKEPSFADLIDIKEWDKIQDNFHAVTGIALRTLDAEGRSINSPRGTIRICAELLNNSPFKDKICGLCLPTFLGGRETVDKNLSWICGANLRNFITPLKLNNINTLGYVIAGPVILVARRPKEEYRGLADELSISLEELWGAVLEIRVSSFHGMASLMELVRDVGESILNLAYKNLFTKKEKVIDREPSGKLRKVLEALLDVVFEVSKADIGSVMFLDKSRGELTIEASRGIPDNIVSQTRVKLGEGISGLAAKEGEPFLIGTDTPVNNRLRPFLRRPNLSSSMVLPLKLENEVLGVMNVGALQISPVRFNSDSLNLVKRLIDLVTIAIHD